MSPRFRGGRQREEAPDPSATQPLRTAGAPRTDCAGPLPNRAVHRFEEHTGELKLRVDAPTLAELFEEAGGALADLMSGEGAGREANVTEHVALSSSDREGLLVDWLNEIILRAEVRHLLVREIWVDRLTERELSATLLGATVRSLRNPVKAATFHELAVRESQEGFEATVILDV